LWVQDRPFVTRKKGKDTFDKLAAIHHSSMRDLVNCQACHQAKSQSDRPFDKEILDRLLVDKLWRHYLDIGSDSGLNVAHGDEDYILVVRRPKKSTPQAEAEFLRRACLDLAGRTPTLLEMHYFLKDTDPKKHYNVVNKLAGGSDAVEIINPVTKRPTRESRAEDYVKEKLGKKQLTPEERQLVQKVLEFTEKERPK